MKTTYNAIHYYDLGGGQYLTKKQRVASTSTITAWFLRYRPEILDQSKVRLPPGVSWDAYTASIIHSYKFPVTKELVPVRSTLFQLVRDPIDRFRSICAKRIQEGDYSDAEAVLVAAESDKLSVTDCVDQVSSLVAGCVTRIFRYDRDLTDFLTAAGLDPATFPSLNESEVDVTLTADQIARVEQLYAEDIALYNSIDTAGFEINLPAPPPDPLPPEEAAQAAIQQAYDTAAAAFEAMPKGKQALWEPVRQKVAAAILSGNMAEAVEILNTTPVIYEGAEADRDVFLALLTGA